MPEADLAREWLVQSDRDLRGARTLAASSDPLFDLAAFLAQQAAETALKGFLAAHGMNLEKTHDLGRLLELVAPMQPEFSRFDDVADVLSGYVALTRYPDEGAYIPSRDETDAAIRASAEIHAFVRECLGMA